MADGATVYVEREGERAEEILAELGGRFAVMDNADMPNSKVIFNVGNVMYIEAREIRDGQKGKMW